MDLLKRVKEFFGFIEYKINEHYIPAVKFQEQHFLPVTIIKGPYKGLTFSFENVQWNKLIASLAVNDGDAVPSSERMVATYDIKFIVKGLRNAALTYKKFKWTADDIWTDYAAFIADNHNKLKQQVLTDKTEEYPDEEYRTDDIEEFAAPRGLRSKGPALPTQRVRARQKRTSAIGRDKGLHSKVQPTSVKDSD
jgi:hypothetical protein